MDDDNDNSSYLVRSVGLRGSLDYRAYISFNGHAISALHDVPLVSGAANSSPSSAALEPTASQDLTLNMVVECPRWTSARMVLATAEPLAPIKHATRTRGSARGTSPVYVRNIFPHRGFIWNYGVLPQTWYDQAPIHACEIGERVADIGDVRRVRVLGILAPRDERSLQWTVLVIDTTDPLSDRLQTVADIDRVCPGTIAATKEWFRLYKLPDGKPENTFDLRGEVRDADFAREVVREAHAAWRDAVTSRTSAGMRVDLTNVTIQNSPGLLRIKEADENAAFVVARSGTGEALPDPVSADKWWHIGSRYG
ncbi:Pantothenate kinase [Mycena kentingensis (nom. inval.)]|nr:Pantothenate kinase [Mycena kentingensis (nom. inval.)]